MEHTLPQQLTSFVGRDAELAELEHLTGQRRLVTLTGMGGSGKTRLAVEVCGRLADRTADRLCFVDLGTVTDQALLPHLVSSALGLSLEPRGHQVEALAAALADRDLLLCLDTCEHALPAVAELVEVLLRRCPHVSVLATSREPLAVAGETVWRVPPLRPSEAERLFADRAGLVAPQFDLERVQDEVRAVCARLDYLPLATELAAAWARALSPAQILAGLAESLQMLAGGPRGTAVRHRTLFASMDWSYALLTDDERVMFRRLACFAGPFTLDAARAVGGDRLPEGPAGYAATLRLVGRLLDTSLISAREVGGEIRYRLLDTVRQYAAEQLDGAGETELARDRHLDYFLAQAETAAAGMDCDEDPWRLVLDGHRSNMNAALGWGLTPPAERLARGRRLAAALARYWLSRGYVTEGSDFVSRAIAADPADESPLQAHLYAGAAMLAMIGGRVVLVAEYAERGRVIAERTGDGASLSRCLAMAAYPYFHTDFARCQEIAAQAGEAAELAGDKFAQDWAAVVEGYSLQTRNRHDEALALSRAAFDRSWRRGDRFCAGFARGIGIFTTMLSGDVPAAVAIGREVLQIVAPLGDYFAVGTNACNAAHAIAVGGGLKEARALMNPIITSLDKAPEADVVGFMVSYGLVHLWEGDLEGAVAWLQRGVQRMSGGNPDWTAVRCLPGLVGALRRLGRVEEAARHAARGIELASAFGAMYELTSLLDEQARMATATDSALARDLLGQSLTIRRAYRLRMCYADGLDALAALTALTDPAEGVRLCAVADSARDATGYPRPPVDRAEHEKLVTAMRADIGDDGFTESYRNGAAADLDVAVAALTRGRGPHRRAHSGWDALTPTEVDVARLVATGLSNPEIAGRLYMSRSTVKAHLAHIYRKLSVANRTELATVVMGALPPG